MIEEITLKNIYSFKDKVTFSFEATADKTFDSTHVVVMPNGTRLLKLGIIYGSNASGKSNFLYAIEDMRYFLTSDPENMDSPTGFEPFMLDKETPNQPSEFSIKFWVDGIRYCYQLHSTSKSVVYEKLSYYKTTQPIMVFKRVFEDGQSVLTFNPKVQKIGQEEQKILSLYCLPNKSFFAARGRINMKMEHIDIVREWIRNKFMPLIDPGTDMNKYAHKKISEDNNFKEYLLNFMHWADFNITGIDSDFINEHVPEHIQKLLLENNNVPNDMKESLLENGTMKKSVLVFEHTVENKRGTEKYLMNFRQQSEGTKRMMGIESAIYETINNNAFLAIDEIESSLHPDLLEYILQKYLMNSGNSQLLITTHYPGLLSTINDLLRKDNIWFVEKEKNGATDLYSLVEFNGLNKISHFERAYRNGQFGALPNIID